MARFAPWREAERLLASAVTFPLWRLGAELFLVLGDNIRQRAIAVGLLTALLGAVTLFP